MQTTEKNRLFTVRNMAQIGVLAAAATVVMMLKFPVAFLAPPFYKLDFSEVFVLLGGFAMGPAAGVMIEFLKVLLNLVIDGTLTAGIGEFANFLMGSAFVIPAALIYRGRRKFSSAVLGVLAGGLLMTAAAGALNYFMLIPAYVRVAGYPLDAIIGMGQAVTAAVRDLFTLILFTTTPFNLLKAVLNAGLVLLIYKPLERVLTTNA